MARLAVKTTLTTVHGPVRLGSKAGAKKSALREVVHAAVPAEDRMQAFLWRHVVPGPGSELLVFAPKAEPPPKRVRLHSRAASAAPKPVAAAAGAAVAKVKFTKQQVAGRLREIKCSSKKGS